MPVASTHSVWHVSPTLLQITIQIDLNLNLFVTTGREDVLVAGESYSEMASLEAFDAFGNRAWLIEDYSYINDNQFENQTTDMVHVSIKVAFPWVPPFKMPA